MSYGTLTVLDTLAASQQSLVQYGVDRAFQGIADLLEAYRRISTTLGPMLEASTDRQRRYGTGSAMTMDVLDESGRAAPQKVAAGDTVGFPLRGYGVAVQWTDLFMRRAGTANQLAAQFTAAFSAYELAIQREIKRAIFYPTNVTFTDYRVDGVSLAVKRLVNADSANIPPGPNGEVFNGATHTHYLGTASFVVADLVALVETVVEHYTTGVPVININRAQEATIRGFTGFFAYQPAQLVNQGAAVIATGQLLQDNIYDRAIGILSSGGITAEVRVKPWVPANYIHAWMEGAPAPLVFRTDNDADGALHIVFEGSNEPFNAKAIGVEFGIGVWNRTNGAVLRSNNATYAAPTIP